MSFLLNKGFSSCVTDFMLHHGGTWIPNQDEHVLFEGLGHFSEKIEVDLEFTCTIVGSSMKLHTCLQPLS